MDTRIALTADLLTASEKLFIAANRQSEDYFHSLEGMDAERRGLLRTHCMAFVVTDEQLFTADGNTQYGRAKVGGACAIKGQAEHLKNVALLSFDGNFHRNVRACARTGAHEALHLLGEEVGAVNSPSANRWRDSVLIPAHRGGRLDAQASRLHESGREHQGSHAGRTL